jgi:hypothetical protein
MRKRRRKSASALCAKKKQVKTSQIKSCKYSPQSKEPSQKRALRFAPNVVTKEMRKRSKKRECVVRKVEASENKSIKVQ